MRLGKSQLVELFHHARFHLRTRVIGESDGQNMLIFSAIVALIIIFVLQFQKAVQMSSEASGKVVKDQIVGFAGASRRGIDLEHE